MRTDTCTHKTGRTNLQQLMSVNMNNAERTSKINKKKKNGQGI